MTGVTKVSDTEALLYLIGVPVVVIAVVWALAYRGTTSMSKRYRPGRRYETVPVWYVASQRPQPNADRPELEADRGRTALPAAPQPAETTRQPVGGASERW